MAKMAANVQLLTGGRLLFGVGAGWMEEEYHAYNWEFPKPSVRIAQMVEAIRIVKQMWTEAPASFEGKYYRIENAYCEPQPDPIPPIMIGGGGEQLTLRAVAELADWWNIPGVRPEVYPHKLDVLRGHCDAVGRDYDEIVKTYNAETVIVAESEAEGATDWRGVALLQRLPDRRYAGTGGGGLAGLHGAGRGVFERAAAGLPAHGRDRDVCRGSDSSHARVILELPAAPVAGGAPGATIR